MDSYIQIGNMALAVEYGNAEPDLTPDYWDCDCGDDDYIRPKENPVCAECGAERDEMPDAHLTEVVDYLRLPRVV